MKVFIKKSIWLLMFAVLMMAVLIAINTILHGEGGIAGELIFLLVISPISMVILAISRHKINSY